MIPMTDMQCPHCHEVCTVPAMFGHYLLREQLGEGGTGPIFRAQDTKLNRVIAIKILHRVLALNEDLVRFFRHQAQAAAALNHLNVLKIYELGKIDDQHFITMELIDGDNLRDLIIEDDITEEEVLQIGLGVAEGLQAAEEAGLVHGDVRPKNIFIDENGVPKISDFGFARSLSMGSARPYSWVSPYYTAPERFQGKPEDVKGDLYGLGASLYHALTGRPPFDDPDPDQVIEMKSSLSVPDIRVFQPAYHVRTAAIIARLLERDPASRYPTYRSVMSDLQEVINELEVTATRQAETQRVMLVSEEEVFVPGSRTFRWVLSLVVAGVLGLLAVVFWPKGIEDSPLDEIPPETHSSVQAPAPAPRPAVDPFILAEKGLGLWLRADAGFELDGGAAVGVWNSRLKAPGSARPIGEQSSVSLINTAGLPGVRVMNTLLRTDFQLDPNQPFYIGLVCEDLASSSRKGSTYKTLLGTTLPNADNPSFNLFLDRDFENLGGLGFNGQVLPDCSIPIKNHGPTLVELEATEVEGNQMELKLAVNGVVQDKLLVPIAPSPANLPFLIIGGFPGMDAFFDGVVYEMIVIQNRRLPELKKEMDRYWAEECPAL